MKIDDLRLFVYAVKYGSFSAAAKYLDIPPATLSRRIQKLEQTLQVKLLVRNARGMALTNAGESIWNLSHESILKLDSISSQIVSDIEDESGLISIAAPSSFISYVLAPLLDDFIRRYPGVRLDFYSTDEPDPSFKVFYDHSVDVAFRFGEQRDSGLVAKKIRYFKASLAATPQYLERMGHPKHPQDLEQHDLLGFRGFLEFDFRRGDERYQVQKQLRIRSVDPFMITRFGCAGQGIFPAVGFDCDASFSDGSLVELLPQWDMGGGDLYVVYSDRSQLSRRVRLLIDFITEKMSGDLMKLFDLAADQ